MITFITFQLASQPVFIRANHVEKYVSLSIEDFYYQQSIDPKFTTSFTNGEDVVGNLTSTCDIPVSGRLGHVQDDVSGGFRLNASTLLLNVEMGTRSLIGLGGQVYTSTTGRRLRVNGNDVGDPLLSSVPNQPQSFTRIDLLTSLTGSITIQGSGSIGLFELILYYTESTPETSSSESSSFVASTSTSTPNYTYEGYYASINGLADAEVQSGLTSIVRSILDGSNLLPTNITYGDARYDIPLFDTDPNNSNNVILVYSQTSVSGTWDGGTTWNREHVFPQSLMGVETSNSSRHKGADYHNLKPESPSVNSSRGNKYFSNTTTTTTYAPPDEVKGDIARILFYMVTMWPELSLVDIASGDPDIYTMGQLSLLVQWHFDDPVNDFELNRNNVIYSLQGNRNPYVDHEELVCRVWKNSSASTQSLCNG